VATVQLPLLVDPSAPGGEAWLSATWLDALGRPLDAPLPLGTVTVTPLDPPVTTVPELPRPLDARLGDAIRLLGSDLPATARPGEPLRFQLAWRAEMLVPMAYTVLVHLVRLADAAPEDGVPTVDDAAAIAAQADGPPAGGARPTTSWRPGEVILDPREIVLPADLAPGTYAVLVGLYDARDPTFARLPTVSAGDERADGRVPIGVLTVAP